MAEQAPGGGGQVGGLVAQLRPGFGNWVAFKRSQTRSGSRWLWPISKVAEGVTW